MKNKFLKVLFTIILIGVVALAFNKYSFKTYRNSKVSVGKWENLYLANNIHFYYQNKDDINIQQAAESFKINELLKNEKDDLKKALKLMEWLKGKVEYKPNNMNKEGYAIEILKGAKDGENTLNDRDYCSIYAELANAAGLNVRKGELRVKNADKDKKKYNHFICELWSEKHNKWIMLDPANSHYITHNGKPISTVEALQKGIENIQVLGSGDAKKYIKNIKKYFYSYTISIDNRIYGIKKSNSFITYIKSGEMPEIYIKDNIVEPSIFTNKDTLFNISPKVDYDKIQDKKSDEIGTLIFSQRKNEDAKDSKKKDTIQLYGGVFKDSAMENKYYISINNGQWKEVNKYFEVTLQNGENSIKLSEDKQKVQREVIINYNGK